MEAAIDTVCVSCTSETNGMPMTHRNDSTPNSGLARGVSSTRRRTSRKLVRTFSRDRLTFSLSKFGLWHSPHDGESHRHKSLSENVRRSRATVLYTRTHKSPRRANVGSVDFVTRVFDLGVQLVYKHLFPSRHECIKNHLHQLNQRVLRSALWQPNPVECSVYCRLKLLLVQ